MTSLVAIDARASYLPMQKMPQRGAAKTPMLSPEELKKALDVKPPSDPQALEDHVHQLLMRAQVSWLSKRDVLDILTNWEVYNLPISLMPPDRPGRATLPVAVVSVRAAAPSPSAVFKTCAVRVEARLDRCPRVHLKCCTKYRLGHVPCSVFRRVVTHIYTARDAASAALAALPPLLSKFAGMSF